MAGSPCAADASAKTRSTSAAEDDDFGVEDVDDDREAPRQPLGIALERRQRARIAGVRRGGDLGRARAGSVVAREARAGEKGLDAAAPAAIAWRARALVVAR